MKIYGINGKMNIVGERVKQKRNELDISQTDLAARLQVLNVIVEQKAISRIELGDRLVADYELLALAESLETTVMWLLTGQ